MKQKDKCTKETILKNQEIIKKEPEFIDAKTWSYVIEPTQDHKPTHKQPKNKSKQKPKTRSKKLKIKK